MISRQHGDQRLVRQHLEDQTRTLFLGPKEGYVQLSSHQRKRELRGGLSTQRDFDLRCFLAEHAQ